MSRKTDSQTNLLQQNDLLNALLLNEKQTDESYQIFMPFNNIKNVFLKNCKMSKMHVNHSRVVVDLEKTLQCGSAERKTAKLDQTS